MHAENRTLDYLLNQVYEGKFAEIQLSREYAPYLFGEKGDTHYHLTAKEMAGKPSIKLAKALREFRAYSVEEHFGTRVLKEFVRQTAKVSEEELRKYSLQKDLRREIVNPMDCQLTEGKFSHRFGNIFFDGKFAFCLRYDKDIIAYICFNPDDKKLVIPQIQGIKGDVERLNRVNWKKALVTTAVKFSHANEIPEIEIISVANSKWAVLTFGYLKEIGMYPADWDFTKAKTLSEKEKQELAAKIRKAKQAEDCRIHLVPHRGFAIYDGTAQDCGFETNDAGNYTLRNFI